MKTFLCSFFILGIICYTKAQETSATPIVPNEHISQEDSTSSSSLDDESYAPHKRLPTYNLLPDPEVPEIVRKEEETAVE